MKKMLLTGLVAAVALALSAGTGAAKKGFSLSSVRGTYASTSHGTTDGTGTLIADGAGNITGGTETVDDGVGDVCTGTLSGSYTVNSDGTGTLTITFTTDHTAPNIGACPSVSATSHAAMVVVSKKRIEVSGTDPTMLESGSLTRQSPSDDDD
jgi:hypothetical protein